MKLASGALVLFTMAQGESGACPYFPVLYILFFTSEMWVFAQYRKSIETLSNSKTLANLLLVICAAIEIGLLYFIGIVSGKLVPFKQ